MVYADVQDGFFMHLRSHFSRSRSTHHFYIPSAVHAGRIFFVADLSGAGAASGSRLSGCARRLVIVRPPRVVVPELHQGTGDT